MGTPYTHKLEKDFFFFKERVVLPLEIYVTYEYLKFQRSVEKILFQWSSCRDSVVNDSD